MTHTPDQDHHRHHPDHDQDPSEDDRSCGRPTDPTSELVADQLATLIRATAWCWHEMDNLRASTVVLTDMTICRLEMLLIELRAAVRVSTALSTLDPDTVRAGYRTWQRRQHGQP